MHIRYSTCIGQPVVEQSDNHELGHISGILIDPDTGKIEGFLVRVRGLSVSADLFCNALDIVRWGTRVYIQSADVLAPTEDRIRLQGLLSDPRTVLNQPIRTESGTYLGRCSDIQFDTKAMHMEWLFPKKWFRYGVALPISEVIEVRNDAIVVRDQMQKENIKQEDEQSSTATTLPEIDPGLARGRFSNRHYRNLRD